MSIALTVAGVILMLLGSIWFLQGINVLPGSFMTGQLRWAVIGGIDVALGLILIVLARRRRKQSSTRH